MINKKLLSFDRAALRYVGANVAFQWLGLVCNIIFVRAVARLVGAAFAGSLTAAAWAHGVGSCIMGAIDRPALTKLLGLPEGLRLCYMVALGYPTHESHLVEIQDGSVKYYLDENRNYCVPKRGMEEVLIKTL